MPGVAGLLAAAALLASVLLHPTPARGQAASDSAALAGARRLVENGAYGAAADILAGYLDSHPDQARVRWLYARTLYWNGQPERARRQYERTLQALPEETSLRVDYARMLVHTGHLEEARDVLAPAPEQARAAGAGSAAADAYALLGKLAYWSGEYRVARRHLAAALRSAPGRRPEARRILEEIQRMSAPWLALGGEYRDDNQPLRNRGLILEAAVPVTPRLEVGARADPRQLEAGAGQWRDFAAAEVTLDADWPGPVETRLAAGRLRHASAERSGWTGGGELTVDLGAKFAIGATAERWNYRYTTGILDTAVFVESAGGRLRREDPTGWGGQVGGRIDRFPGGNEVRSAHAWVLAPLWSTADDALRLGYAFRTSDAEESTFRPLSGSSGNGPGPGAGPPVGGPGRDRGGAYQPYYTPEQVSSHSAIAALLLRPSSRLLLSLDGAVGVHATEQAPQVAGGGTAGTRVEFVDRDYTPWRVRGRFRAETSRRTALSMEAGYREDAFFEVLELSVRWTYRFLGGLPGR